MSTKRGITDSQSFKDVFSEKPHLIITNVLKELQNIWNINQELKFTFTLCHTESQMTVFIEMTF